MIKNLFFLIPSYLRRMATGRLSTLLSVDDVHINSGQYNVPAPRLAGLQGHPPHLALVRGGDWGVHKRERPAMLLSPATKAPPGCPQWTPWRGKINHLCNHKVNHLNFLFTSLRGGGRKLIFSHTPPLQ